MAAPSEGLAFAVGVEKNWGAVVRSPEGTPQKIRQLIDEGIASEEGGVDARDTSATSQSLNGSPQVEQSSLESTSKEAFFSRVETFSSLKWAGKPSELSPLVCAKYGWVTVECDMLKCSSCQAFLCASLQPAFDFDRCLTEDKISLLLHLLEDELDHRTDERKTTTKLGSDIQVHVTACILSVCGWACSSSLEPMQLSLIACSQCMRKVGLWGFQQIESSIADLDTSFGLTSSPIPGLEGRPERFPLVPESPRRMMTRSQDATFSPGSEQDTSSRSFFDPTSQHRDWCPWVNITLGKESRENGGTEPDASTPAEPGWKAVLTILLAHKQSSQPAETDSVSLSEKSRKVFRIFRQWESLCSS
uniref:Zinc finger C3HC-type containing 1 n=1 Tax=Saimiri boliviensis boliviensis TaxID=39432 RepID=A0A2K6UMT6_SAIBB